MNVSAIETALYAWIAARAPTATVYWAEQDAPRPANPSVSLKLTGPRKISTHGDELKSKDGSETAFLLTGPREFTLSINVYGATAQQVASDLITSTGIPDVQHALRAAGLAVYNVGQANDLSELMETAWEKRAQFDVIIGARESLETEPGVIEETTVTSVVGGVSSTFTQGNE